VAEGAVRLFVTVEARLRTVLAHSGGVRVHPRPLFGVSMVALVAEGPCVAVLTRSSVQRLVSETSCVLTAVAGTLGTIVRGMRHGQTVAVHAEGRLGPAFAVTVCAAVSVGVVRGRVQGGSGKTRPTRPPLLVV